MGAWLGAPGVRAGVTDSAGAALFQEKGCVACHGERLEGGDKGPNLRGVGRRLKREQIERQIKEGGNNMPPFGDVLESSEVTALVEYLGKQREKPGKVARTRSQERATADSLRE